ASPRGAAPSRGAAALLPPTATPSVSSGAPTALAAQTRSSGAPPPLAAQPAGAPGAPPALAAQPTGAPGAPPALAGPGCVDDGAPYDAASLRAQVAYLAAPELDGRASGTAGDLAARRHLAERFRCLGLVPAGADGSYEQPFTAGGHATANLVGYLPGNDAAVGGDIILVGAHHDHLGGAHLGANDDASGAAALLAIAQAIRRHGAPRRTIAFVAFGGEELGLVGSAYFAAHPPPGLPIDRIVYDINLDMIGSYASAGAVYAMGTFRGLAATRLVRALVAEHPALRVGLGGRGVGSDHEAFCAAGVPYVFFWTPDRRCYHARCDTVDRLDAAHAAEIAALAGALVEQLSSSATDLAAARDRLGCTGR
ncbi:MAG TPA: M28 family peptidase, partial [Kofleriaceae bacterium]|nr:M28 family peptidase [Kofleriaceae bacterium]